jgi:hypothetical protein
MATAKPKLILSDLEWERIATPNPLEIHIIPRNEGTDWAVIRRTNKKPYAILHTIQDAIDKANSIKIEGKQILLHRAPGDYEYI